MPRSTSGKWVARRFDRRWPDLSRADSDQLVPGTAAHRGGGCGSVVYARGEYRSAAAADTVPPTKGTTWYVGYVLDICGTLRQPVTANETDPTTQSFYTVGNGVIVVSPKKTTVAGTHAVLGKFANGYPGMKLSATAVTVPPSASKKATAPTSSAVTTTTTTAVTPATTTTTAAAATATTTTTAATSAATSAHSDIQLDAKTKKNSSTTTGASGTGSTTSTGAGTTTTKTPATTTTTTQPSKTYTNGETCAKGTKDAGKQADVMVTYWANAFDSKGKPSTASGDPATLLFSSNQEITIGFVPPGTTLPKPTGTVVEALLNAATGASASTSTTTAASTATTLPVTTTTSTSTSTTTAAAAATAASTSTTAPVTTTTAAPVTTTTAASTTTTGKKKT